MRAFVFTNETLKQLYMKVMIMISNASTRKRQQMMYGAIQRVHESVD
jgi:hypothetical protein